MSKRRTRLFFYLHLDFTHPALCYCSSSKNISRISPVVLRVTVVFAVLTDSTSNRRNSNAGDLKAAAERYRRTWLLETTKHGTTRRKRARISVRPSPSTTTDTGAPCAFGVKTYQPICDVSLSVSSVSRLSSPLRSDPLMFLSLGNKFSPVKRSRTRRPSCSLPPSVLSAPRQPMRNCDASW